MKFEFLARISKIGFLFLMILVKGYCQDTTRCSIFKQRLLTRQDMPVYGYFVVRNNIGEDTSVLPEAYYQSFRDTMVYYIFNDYAVSEVHISFHINKIDTSILYAFLHKEGFKRVNDLYKSNKFNYINDEIKYEVILRRNLISFIRHISPRKKQPFIPGLEGVKHI